MRITALLFAALKCAQQLQLIQMLGWGIRSEFRGIPRLFQFQTFWTPEFSSEFYIFQS